MSDFNYILLIRCDKSNSFRGNSHVLSGFTYYDNLSKLWLYNSGDIELQN